MFLVPFSRGLARHLHLACFALIVATTTVFAQTNAPSANDGFDPNVNGTVLAMVTQPSDGKLIVVGQFDTVQPNGGDKVIRYNIARFNTDGSVDRSFDPNANGTVRTVILQRNGQIIIGGDFTKVDGNTHNYVARLNPNGSPDDSFTASIGKSLDASVALPTTPQVLALAVQPSDGAVVVGGTFGSASSAGVAAIQRNNLVRFRANGSLDTTYNPNPNAAVLSLAMHRNNQLIVGGGFTAFTPTGATSATTRYHVARLNQDGSIDSFDPATDNAVEAIAVQPDGKVLLGGSFSALKPNSADSSTTRYYLARVNTDGSLDTDFSPTVGGFVSTIVVTPDGGIMLGGHFQQIYSGSSTQNNHAYVARLTLAGLVDDTFIPNVNSDVNAITFQPDGKIVIGGAFTRAVSPGTSTQVVRNHVARLQPNGTLDNAFVIDSSGRILTSVTLADNSTVVGGSFITLGGVSRVFIARIAQDGTVSTTYYPIINGPVYTMAYDAKNDKLIVGGAFTAVGAGTNPTTRNHIARLNGDGSLDTTFDPNLNGYVSSIVIQSDGSILVGGTFSTAQPSGTDTAVARSYILRLTSAGQLDTAFNPTASSTVTSIALQTDGKILIGGNFTTLQPGATGNGYTRAYIARLNADGTVDTNYNPNTNAQVNAIVIQSDGKAVIGGDFTAFFPLHASAVSTRNRIARLNTDGTIDSTFDPNADNFVLALALQADGKIVVGGLFTTFQPNGASTATTRRYVARLKADGTLDDTFNLDLNEQLGNRVDYIAVQPASEGSDILIGGSFISLQPVGSASRVTRTHLARIKSSGALDTAYDPHPSGTANTVIKALSIQADGKILVGGTFTDIGGATAPYGVNSLNIARFNPEGTPDLGFNGALTTDGTVNALAVRPTATATATQLSGFAWLDANGGLRSSFKPNITTQGRINASVILPDGNVILAGVFTDSSGLTSGNLTKVKPTGEVDTTYTPAASGIFGMFLQPTSDPNAPKLVIYGGFTTVNGTAQSYIARLNFDGTLDTTFAPTPNAPVNAAVLQPDGSIVLGGTFTTLQPTGDTTTTARNYIARVDTTGKIDANFNPNLNGAVQAIALQPNGNATSPEILVGGAFTTAQPGSDTTATTRNHILRLSSTGTLDSFDPNASDVVYALAVQPADQKILVGGSFATIGSATHDNIARLNADGSIDSSFTVAASSTVTVITIGADTSIIIGGFFANVTESGSTIPIARNHLARLSIDGKLDKNFNPAFAGQITGVTIAADKSVLVGGTFTTEAASGIILVGGAFSQVGGLSQPYLAQLNADGSVNPQFQPNPDQAVSAVLPLADGKFLVAGSFTKFGSTARTGIARFTATGDLDSTFNANLTGSVDTMALQPDGKLLVGMSNSTGVIRLNADGSRDTGFNAAVPFAPAVAIVVQTDGKIVVAGPGSGVGPRIVRLNADGSVDGSFPTVSFNNGGTVQALTLQADGAIFVAGSFTTIGGTAIANLARLTPAGAVDTSFNANIDNTVSAVALQADGRVMVGGSFSSIGGLARFSLARLSNTAPAPQTLGVSADGRTVTWLRSGTSGEIVGVTFESSTDGITWTLLGSGTRIGTSPGSGWQITNLSLPTSGNFYIRAHGMVPTVSGKSTGVYEAVLLRNLGVQLTTSDTIVAPVISTTKWDASHYFWTVNSSGVLRIVDAFSEVAFDSNSTVLINGGSVGDGTTSSSSARLADLSTRGIVGANAPLISGFAIVGSSSRQVLIRAAGPGLAPFGVTNYLKVPQLVLYNSAGTVLATNKSWDASLLTDFARVGAFPFTVGSTDTAFLVTLNPGRYTVQVTDAGDGNGGDTLVEVYDASSLADTSARLMNLSTRGTVLPGATLIGGLVVSGDNPKTLLVRGVGPALAHYGVSDVLSDPTIAVYDAGGVVIATNDNWSVSSMGTSDYAAALSSAAQSVGAFSFDANSADAALVITLPAGAYTVQLRGANGTSGGGMIEVYELR